MATSRPFRFTAALGAASSAAELGAQARQAEALGYARVGIGDHFSTAFEPGPALTAAALVTSTIRLGTVFANDFRHPAILAKVVASIDVLSGGRFECGIGAGWDKGEFDQAGIPFDPPGVRVSRLEEAVQIIKGLWADGPFTFAGQHYTITGLDGMPKPLQRPHPPIFMGGGGRRLLRFAAREADIVGIAGIALPGGGLNLAELTEAALVEKTGWVRAAAGNRFDQLELHMMIWNVVVTDDRQVAAERLAAAGGFTAGLTVEQILASAQFLIGSIDQIAESLVAQRERHGISHLTVFAPYVETFAPVIARLAGQ